MSGTNMPAELAVEIKRLINRFQRGGDRGPIGDRHEWEKRMRFHSVENRQLLDELARFSDLWNCLRQRKEKLGSETVNAMLDLCQLPVPKRIQRMQEINRKLMERFTNAGEDTRFRN
jgi:hypothetical protein